jgi:tRNA (guanine-N7-)-methyltransferase
MARSGAESARINPYTRWIYDHPGCLLPHPDPEQLAGRLAGRPCSGLVVDLGCGSGNFLLRLAERDPSRGYVGFELRYKRLVKAAGKLERQGLDNVWLLRERAEVFGAYFAEASVDALHVNFPDPWPKAGQWKKRLVSRPFLEEAARVLKPGGRLHLKTDHSGYFLHVLEVIRGFGSLRLRTLCNDLARLGGAAPEARSEFEQLFHAKRRPVYYLVLEAPERE